MAVNINAKGTTYKSFQIGKQGVNITQGDVAPTENVKNGDIWLDTRTFTPRVFNAVAEEYQLPLMDGIGFKDNMIVSLVTSDEQFTTSNTMQDISIDADISNSINRISQKSTEVIIGDSNTADLTREDFINNIVVKGSGLFGGLLLANDGNTPLIKTSDGDHLRIRAGNVVLDDDNITGKPGDLYLSGGTTLPTGESGNVIINDITFPNEDGTANQMLVTDGNGNLVFKDQEQIDTVTLIDLVLQEELPEHKIGRIFFNKERDTLSYYNSVDGFEVNIGQELFVNVHNNTDQDFVTGSVVVAESYTDGIVKARLAQASDAMSARVLGVCVDTIKPNESGLVATAGVLDNIDTVLYTIGDVLWLSDEVAGGLTTKKPDLHASKVGTVLFNGSNGKIHIEISNNQVDKLYKLDDLILDNPENGHGIIYENGKWVNKRIDNINIPVGGQTFETQSGNVIDGSKVNYGIITDNDTLITVHDVPDGAYELTLLITNYVVSPNFSNMNIKWRDGEVPNCSTYDDIIKLITVDNGETWYGDVRSNFR